MRYGLVLSFCWLLAGCDRSAPSPALPTEGPQPGGSVLASRDAAEVTRIEVSLDWDEEKHQPGGNCLVAPSDHANVLALFAGGVVDPNPARWEVLGGIDIEYRGGRRLYVNWFRVGKKGAYKIGETYYRGSSDGAFLEVFKSCGRSRKPVSP